MKVVFFGDSLTWGGYGGDYVAEIQHLVGDRHEIINAGVGGNTVVNLNRRLEKHVLIHEPDAVFVMVGGNDAVSYSQPDSRPYYRKSMHLEDGFVSPDTFSREYRHLLAELQGHFIHTYVGLEPTEANRTVVDTLKAYNERIKEAARVYNVPVLDLFDRFVPEHIPDRKPVSIRFIQQIGDRERTGWNDWYTAQEEGGYAYTFDGVHWTPKTASEVARLIVEFMEL